MKKSRLLDFAAYIAIGLMIVVGAVWIAQYPRDLGRRILQWAECIAIALCFTAVLWYRFRRAWRQRGFWLAMAVTLGGYAVTVGFLWTQTDQVRPGVWGFLLTGGIACGMWLFPRLTHPPVKVGRPRRKSSSPP